MLRPRACPPKTCEILETWADPELSCCGRSSKARHSINEGMVSTMVTWLTKCNCIVVVDLTTTPPKGYSRCRTKAIKTNAHSMAANAMGRAYYYYYCTCWPKYNSR